MKKITWRLQLIIVFLIMGIGHLVAHLIQNGICINVAYIIIGLLFIINPVYPNINQTIEPRKGVLGARIAGILIILLGLMVRNVI